jgi:membrane-bound ClpP family serine protease
MPFEVTLGDDATQILAQRQASLDQALAQVSDVMGRHNAAIAGVDELRAETRKTLAEVIAREVQIADNAEQIQEASVSIVALARHVRKLFAAAIASPVVIEVLIHLPGWLRHA